MDEIANSATHLAYFATCDMVVIDEVLLRYVIKINLSCCSLGLVLINTCSAGQRLTRAAAHYDEKQNYLRNETLCKCRSSS